MAIDMRELGVVKVATPCKAKWSEMKGDDTIRRCALCDKNVYHLSRLTSDEARELFQRTEGRLCVRFFARPDGTVLTKDCPVGIRRKRIKVLAALSSAAAMLFGGAAFLLNAGGFGEAASRVKSFLGDKELTPDDVRMRAQPSQPFEGKRLQGFGQNNAY
jgi:hypothetical protein